MLVDICIYMIFLDIMAHIDIADVYAHIIPPKQIWTWKKSRKNMTHYLMLFFIVTNLLLIDVSAPCGDECWSCQGWLLSLKTSRK